MRARSALVAVVVTGVIALGGLALGGYDPFEAGAALLRGAFGSPQAFFSFTLVRSVPLLLTGLAVALAFRAGIWNIGAEGQLYAGAVAATVVGLGAGGLPGFVLVPAVLLASAVAGALWAAVPAVMKVRLGVGEVITTLMMNFVAIHLTAWAVHGPLQEVTGVFPQSDRLGAAAQLPMVPGTRRLHLGILIAVLLAVGLWFVLRATRAGFLLRAVGASPEAARTSGRISTSRVVVLVLLLSGAVAGLAGGVEITGRSYALYENLSPGWGYTAIAVALLAGLHPLGVVLTAVLFGALDAGADAMQQEAGVPAAWVSAVEALVILSVLAVDRGVRTSLHAERGAP